MNPDCVHTTLPHLLVLLVVDHQPQGAEGGDVEQGVRPDDQPQPSRGDGGEEGGLVLVLGRVWRGVKRLMHHR